MPTFISVLLNILINSIPILVVLIPLPFIRKKTYKKLYLRFFWGIFAFFFIYYLLPTIFQVQDPIDEMNLEDGKVNVFAGIFYIFGRTASLITNYFQFPIINLSFIFVVAPLISILFLWSIIRKEDNLGFRKNLAEVTLEIKKSPREIISEKLNKGNWNEEKQLFKLLIVLLPISLYLLTTIMKIANIPLQDIFFSASGLGWFIEIFFVYLASFLFGIHLLKASNVSFKGRFIGEKLLEKTSSSLTAVGIPISILSIVLFLVEYLDQMFLVIYFFGYFLMTAFIFISLLAVFEPISTVILVKIIDSIKNKRREEKLSIQKLKKEDKAMDYLYPLIFGAIGSLVMIVSVSIFGGLSALATGMEDYKTITASANFALEQSLENATLTEVIQVIGNIGFIVLVLLIGFLLSYTIKITKKIGFSSILFSAIFLLIIFVANFPFEGLISLLFSTDAQWITGKLVITEVFGGTEFIYTLRTAFLDATSGVPILLYLALPYNLVRFFMAFIFWGIIFYYARRQFLTKLIRREKLVDQITFSNLDAIPAGEKFLSTEYLITCTPDCQIPADEKEGAKIMIESFREGKFSPEILQDSLEENKKIYGQLEYLTEKNYIQWWISEFSFTFERAQMETLYIINSDGRDVVSYRFAEGESKVDPALVAGMFSAITSFIKETTKSSDLLRTIDHGDSKITIEYGKYVFGAIFADMETTEIRTNLKKFLVEFEKKHGDVLKNWNGATDPFKENDQLVKDIFQV